jgi:signal transduction histidine kinase/rhodanese-related sulfurtransferase
VTGSHLAEGRSQVRPRQVPPRRPVGARTIDEILAAARARLSRVTPAEALAELGAGGVLIDIRPAAQRAAVGEVPGSVVIERNHLEWRLDPASDARLPWVTGYELRPIVICAEGYTSSLAAASLQDLGLALATDVIGGYQAWQAAGLPTARPAERAAVIAPGASPALSGTTSAGRIRPGVSPRSDPVGRRPRHTGPMNRSVNLVARFLGLAWLGAVAFGIFPPSGHAELLLQAVAYGVTCLCMIGWALFDYSPRAARYRPRAFPVILGVIAAATGAAAASGWDGGTAMLIFTVVAVMQAGSDADLQPALAVTAGGILAAEVSGLAFGTYWAALLGYPLLIASGLLLGRNRGAFRVQAEQLAALLVQRERLEAEQRRADVLDERTRIAREIHDVLAHSIGALGIQIQAARSVLTDYGDIDRAVELLTAAQRMAGEGLTETRRAVHALRSDTLPLADELAKATNTYGERYHVAVSLDTEGTPRPVPAEATVALLRVAQESLVNAVKHGAGKPVTVRLDFDAAWVRLTVRNEVDAVVPRVVELSTANAGYGLTGMRERLRLLGGTLEAGREGTCWVVTAQVPLSPSN